MWLRTLRPIWVDASLAALALIAQLWPLLSRTNPHGGPWSWWGYAVVIAATLPVVWRRRAPVTVLLTSQVIGALYDLSDHVAAQPIWYGVLIAMYTVAAQSPRRLRWIIIGVVLVGGLITVGSSDTMVRGIVLYIAAYALGRATAAHEDRAAHLERERQMEAERAAERERARIARDMHDILAHAVSLMVVQAEAGPVVVRSDPARAEATFDAIAGAGRDAMVQLRRLLGVLKEDEGPRSPQPTIADLPTLAEQVSTAGLSVKYTAVGTQIPVPSDIEVAAYRVTQEALTNIVKHSSAAHADIRLHWQDDELMISITDDGTSRSAGLPSSGKGLIGIRERAAACNGTATAGPRTDGQGFQVLVRLPLGVTS